MAINRGCTGDGHACLFHFRTCRTKAVKGKGQGLENPLINTLFNLVTMCSSLHHSFMSGRRGKHPSAHVRSLWDGPGAVRRAAPGRPNHITCHPSRPEPIQPSGTGLFLPAVSHTQANLQHVRVCLFTGELNIWDDGKRRTLCSQTGKPCKAAALFRGARGCHPQVPSENSHAPN